MKIDKPIKLDSFWYRLKRKLFESFGKKEVHQEINEEEYVKMIDFSEIKSPFESKNDLNLLVQKVLRGEIDIKSLSSSEIEKVSQIIREEIFKMDIEAQKIKENIDNIKKKIGE